MPTIPGRPAQRGFCQLPTREAGRHGGNGGALAERNSRGTEEGRGFITSTLRSSSMEAVVREKDSSGHAVIHCHATLEDVGDCTILQDSYAVNMRTLKAQTGMHLDASGSINLGTYVSAAVGSE